MKITIKKNILLAVCGGIAAYKAAELIRLLRQQNADVRVVMTDSAQQFVSAMTFQALSGNPVHVGLLDSDEENAMGHIHLARWADLFIIAPATANTLAKCANGFADNLVTALVLAADCPVYLAPAMNQAMWNKAVTQENIRKLEMNGFIIIGPESGDQACGETGYGRMTEPSDICRYLFNQNQSLSLENLKLLVSAGPTREHIDPVRFITNRSSGKMGFALAQAAMKAGANVTLVSGPVAIPAPAGATLIQVESAAQMHEVVMSQASDSAIYIGAAAVADYSPAVREATKIKKSVHFSYLSLQKTPDILADVAAMARAPFTVGFAAETHNLEENAKAKLQNKRLDMIAANWVGQTKGGFDSDHNALEIFWQNGHATLPMMEKNQLADALINIIATRFHEKNRI